MEEMWGLTRQNEKCIVLLMLPFLWISNVNPVNGNCFRFPFFSPLATYRIDMLSARLISESYWPFACLLTLQGTAPDFSWWGPGCLVSSFPSRHSSSMRWPLCRTSLSVGLNLKTGPGGCTSRWWPLSCLSFPPSSLPCVTPSLSALCGAKPTCQWHTTSSRTPKRNQARKTKMEGRAPFP